MSIPYTFTDPQGDELRVVPVLDHAGGACLIAEHGVNVPPHKLAEVVSAMYEAAGQPVPDLPQIQDPQQVEELARVLYEHVFGSGSQAPDDVHRDYARAALAAGWRKS